MIVPTADRSKASVMVKVRFAERDLRVLPEMSARVAFLEREVTRDEESPRTAVSPAAVVARDGKQAVFIVKDDKAVETAVTLGGKIGDGIEVREGIKPGEKVVMNPPRKLKNGSKVKRKEK
jgi:hypothetical protein